MLQLKKLSEKSIHSCRFPLENSLVDLEKVKFNSLKNYWGGFRKTENKNDFRYYYYNTSDDKNVFWLIDYVRDLWFLKKNKSTVSFKSSFLVQERGDYIPLHNEIIENDFLNSPDISVIYTVDCGPEPVDIIFQNKKKEVLTEKIRIPMKKNNYIIYNSEIDHSFDINQNKEPLINLHFSFHEK